MKHLQPVNLTVVPDSPAEPEIQFSHEFIAAFKNQANAIAQQMTAQISQQLQSAQELNYQFERQFAAQMLNEQSLQETIMAQDE